MHQGKVHINIQSLGQEAYPFSCVLRELEQSGVVPSWRLGRDETQVVPIHDISGEVEILKAVINAIGVDKRLGG